MEAYRTYVTLEDSKQVVLKDLPFDAGQQVEILVLAQNSERETLSRELHALFKKTQVLPQTQSITDEEISAEIEAHRNNA